MENLQIEYIALKDLKPYEKNVRKHGKEDVEKIEASIRDYGMCDPIGIWSDKNIIVEGHGRLQALKNMGCTEAPCIRLDHLTDEQRRGYAIAHNKTAENSEWDYDFLNEEMAELPEIDFSEYGFDDINYDDLFEKELEQKHNKEETQRRVENILNLEFAQFEGAGKYDIPILQPVYDLPEIKEWIGFNYVLSDEDPEGKAVHFFLSDYQFERVWNNPEKYIDKLRRYVCVATPDFSPYGDMPLATQIFNIYRKNWVGAFLQMHGVTVIPTVRASTDERSMEFYLDGIPENAHVIISNMWTESEAGKNSFKNEYETMVEKLHPNKIFMYGKRMEELTENIEYIETFARKRYNKDG